MRGRILVLTSTFPRWPGDSEPRFVHDLCRRLAEAGEVCVLTPHAAGAACDEEIDGVRVIRFRYGPAAWEKLAYEGGIMANLRRTPWLYLMVPSFLLAQWWYLRRSLRCWRPDVVHAHWIVPQGLVLAALASSGVRPRAVCTVHGSDVSALRGSLWRNLRRWVVSRCDRVIAVSESLRAGLHGEGCPVAKLDVIPMGVDLNGLFEPGAQPRQDMSLLFVGRLVPGKGVDFLIRALALLAEHHPQVTLTLVGTGPEADRLAVLARDLGVLAHVRFSGTLPHPQLADCYRKASLLVLPSLEEGFGLVLVEAMGCGCPVVASDLPSLRDLVEEGKSGRLFRRADIADMARVIGELLADPQTACKLAEEARRRVKLRYDWDVVARRYSAILLPGRAEAADT